jgi:LysM repeat protein
MSVRGIGGPGMPRGAGGPGPSEYVTRKGDQLGEIARRFGVSKDAMQKANPGVAADKPLPAGQHLAVPERGAAEARPSGTVRGGLAAHEPGQAVNKGFPEPGLRGGIAAHKGESEPMLRPGETAIWGSPEAQVGKAAHKGESEPMLRPGEAAHKMQASEPRIHPGDAQVKFIAEPKLRAGEGQLKNAPEPRLHQDEAAMQQLKEGQLERPAGVGAQAVLGPSGAAASGPAPAELRLTADQFGFDDRGNLVIKNEEIRNLFRSLVERAGENLGNASWTIRIE